MLASGQVVALHPSSVLYGRRPACIVYDELLRTTRDYARQACSPSSCEGHARMCFFTHGLQERALIRMQPLDMQQSACITPSTLLLHIFLALVPLCRSCTRAGNSD